MRKFVLATRNKGKISELSRLLDGTEIELVGLDDLGIRAEVEETGSTFAENSRLKAREYAGLSGLHSIADDSGLEVNALGGRPGVLSARYKGVSSNYREKMAGLVEEIAASGLEDRSARFVSHVAIAQPDGNIVFEAEGICSGDIAYTERGTGGFGYDPIFIPDGYDQTFGELDDLVKSSISHRAKAISKIIRFLRDFA